MFAVIVGSHLKLGDARSHSFGKKAHMSADLKRPPSSLRVCSAKNLMNSDERVMGD